MRTNYHANCRKEIPKLANRPLPDFAQLCTFEPRLAELRAEARSWPDPGGESFCTYDAYLEAFRGRLLHLVGFWSEKQAPELMRLDAFQAAFLGIFLALPPCRGHGCWIDPRWPQAGKPILIPSIQERTIEMAPITIDPEKAQEWVIDSNVLVARVDQFLVLVVDTSKDLGESSSKKMRSIASTNGFQNLPGGLRGQIFIGRKPQPASLEQ
jgi:hypothetical protein